jgi:hypothetical protein
VTVKAKPHRSGGKTGGGRTGPSCDGFLRIATNRLEQDWDGSGFSRLPKSAPVPDFFASLLSGSKANSTRSAPSDLAGYRKYTFSMQLLAA